MYHFIFLFFSLDFFKPIIFLINGNFHDQIYKIKNVHSSNETRVMKFYLKLLFYIFFYFKKLKGIMGVIIRKCNNLKIN